MKCPNRVRFLACLCVGLALCGLSPAAADSEKTDRLAPDLVIGSGAEGGNYHAIARRLRTLLSQQEEHYAVEVRTSLGSLENLVQLDEPDSPVGLVLSQADALKGYLEVNPEFEKELVVMADVGRECVFMIGARGGDITTAADLKKPGDRTVSVGRPGSGAAVTWAYLSSLDAGFRNSPAVNEDVIEAMAQLGAGERYSKIAATMLVQRPRILAPPLRIAVEAPEAYRLIPFRPGDVAHSTLPDGSTVYTFETVKVRNVALETVCTRGLLLASREKVPESLRSVLARIWLENADYLAPHAR